MEEVDISELTAADVADRDMSTMCDIHDQYKTRGEKMALFVELQHNINACHRREAATIKYKDERRQAANSSGSGSVHLTIAESI